MLSKITFRTWSVISCFSPPLVHFCCCCMLENATNLLICFTWFFSLFFLCLHFLIFWFLSRSNTLFMWWWVVFFTTWLLVSSETVAPSFSFHFCPIWLNVTSQITWRSPRIHETKKTHNEILHVGWREKRNGGLYGGKIFSIPVEFKPLSWSDLILSHYSMKKGAVVASVFLFKSSKCKLVYFH